MEPLASTPIALDDIIPVKIRCLPLMPRGDELPASSLLLRLSSRNARGRCDSCFAEKKSKRSVRGRVRTHRWIESPFSTRIGQLGRY
jgi:hypothetical protein